MSRPGEGVAGAQLRAAEWARALCWTALAIGCGVALAIEPVLAVLPVAALAAIPLVVSPHARLVVVVFGALFVFQTADELTAPKLGYLFALVVSVGAILLRLPYYADSVAYHDLKPMLRASVVTLLLVATSLPVAHLNGVPPIAWLRDIAPYVMVAFAPLFALDAQASIRRVTLLRLLLAAGTLGVLGFTARWVTNRGIADLSVVPLGLPTLVLAASVFAYGASGVLHGRTRRLTWTAFTALVFSMLLSTGTRTALALLAAPLAIVVGSRDRFAQRSLRLVVAVPLVAVLAVLGTEAIVRVADADREILAKRASLLFATGKRGADRSYIDRIAQTESAWASFRSSPMLGIGPGQPIVWANSFNQVQEATVIDSPVSFVAKFGAAGLVAVAFLVLGVVGTLRAFRRRTGTRTVAQMALVGFGATVAILSLLHNPYEDKGFAIGLMLLLALAAREASDAALES